MGSIHFTHLVSQTVIVFLDSHICEQLAVAVKKIGGKNLYFMIKTREDFGTENFTSSYNLVSFPGLDRAIGAIE